MVAFNFPKQSPAATYQTPILENQRQKRVRLLCTGVHIGFDHLSSEQQFIYVPPAVWKGFRQSQYIPHAGRNRFRRSTRLVFIGLLDM